MTKIIPINTQTPDDMELKMCCNMEGYKNLLIEVLLKDLSDKEKKEIQKRVNFLTNDK